MLIPMLSQLLSHHAGANSKKIPQAQLTTAKKAAASSGTSSTTSPSATAAGSATITANDFLSLLVTEIQNQDPTQQTDPMQYITQLVDVNSLEQLVSINQDLTPSTPSTPVSTPTSPTSPTGGAASAPAQTALTNGPQGATSAAEKSSSALLPLGSHSHLSSSASHAVAQSFIRSMPVAVQVAPSQLPPTHVAVQPEVLRAIEMSIPGATMTGASTSGTLVPTPPVGGAMINNH